MQTDTPSARGRRRRHLLGLELLADGGLELRPCGATRHASIDVGAGLHLGGGARCAGGDGRARGHGDDEQTLEGWHAGSGKNEGGGRAAADAAILAEAGPPHGQRSPAPGRRAGRHARDALHSPPWRDAGQEPARAPTSGRTCPAPNPWPDATGARHAPAGRHAPPKDGPQCPDACRPARSVRRDRGRRAPAGQRLHGARARRRLSAARAGVERTRRRTPGGRSAGACSWPSSSRWRRPTRA